MNGLLLLLLALLVFVAAYFFYGRRIDSRLVQPDSKRPTPASTFRDNIDYYPSRRLFLFGHHFSSIAGAGPIVGPVIAAFYFGWCPTFFWLILGAIFIGGVHDYLSLMVSVRNRGFSLARVAQDVISPRTRIIFSIFLWLALILVITIFANFAAKTFINDPAIVIPAFGLILIAMGAGWLINRMNFSPVWATIISLGVLLGTIYLGTLVPISLPVGNPLVFWFVILIVYGIIASLLPVWLLLQPRDYLSSYILFAGLGAGVLGVCITRPTITAPAFVTASSSVGPIWPMLCVIVACGAISGFHSIVASGTSAKQLANEKHGRLIGYGTMLFEGFLAVLALLAVTAGLGWNQFSEIMNTAGGNPITAFAEGYGSFVTTLPGVTKPLAVSFAFIMVNAFIFTTLDTAMRLCRFITAEILPTRIGRVQRDYLIPTVLTVGPVLYMGLTGEGAYIWPVFGAANQLIAALALVVITSYLVGVKKPTRFTLIPTIFMLCTTVAALVYKIYQFFFIDRQIVLGCISAILLCLAFFMVYEARTIWKSQVRT